MASVDVSLDCSAGSQSRTVRIRLLRSKRETRVLFDEEVLCFKLVVQTEPIGGSKRPEGRDGHALWVKIYCQNIRASSSYAVIPHRAPQYLVLGTR